MSGFEAERAGRDTLLPILSLAAGQLISSQSPFNSSLSASHFASVRVRFVGKSSNELSPHRPRFSPRSTSIDGMAVFDCSDDLDTSTGEASREIWLIGDVVASECIASDTAANDGRTFAWYGLS